jgi:PP-loop superfamily ATP-utilizing enzyme
LDPAEMARAIEERSSIVDALRAVGYAHVTLDLGGFRSGGLVEVALERARPT